jgi:hypothetical protein
MSDASAIAILMLGAIGTTGEWRHRTITGTVLTAPNRVRVLAAKTLSHSVAGLLLTLAVTTAVPPFNESRGAAEWPIAHPPAPSGWWRIVMGSEPERSVSPSATVQGRPVQASGDLRRRGARPSAHQGRPKRRP